MIVLPEAFVSGIAPVVENELAAFMESLGAPPPVSIRTNPEKISVNNVADPVPWAEHGEYLASRPSFTLDPLFHAGGFYVQEASSMFVGQAFRQVAATRGLKTVLDLCAAPGGKSTHLLTLMPPDSLLVSNEVIRSRASVLSENLKKWGFPNCMVTSNDPRDFERLEEFFDVIVLDAPCSGEGLFRKDPAAIAEWSPQNVALCASRQKRIIADIWPALKQDGILIYCTCTYNESENEENMRWLADHYDVEFMRLRVDPAWGIREVTKHGITGYRFFPHRARGEGFYLSVISRKGNALSRTPHHRTRVTQLPKSVEQVRTWVRDAGRFRFAQHDDMISIDPAERADEMDFVGSRLRVIHAGTAVASVKHSKLVPEHALALSTHLNKGSFPAVHANRETAIRYLRREVPPLEASVRGFHLVMFKDTPLGWINNLGNRYNNLYPVDWRIRMNPGTLG